MLKTAITIGIPLSGYFYVRSLSETGTRLIDKYCDKEARVYLKDNSTSNLLAVKECLNTSLDLDLIDEVSSLSSDS